jgi:hypothetical protein
VNKTLTAATTLIGFGCRLTKRLRLTITIGLVAKEIPLRIRISQFGGDFLQGLHLVGFLRGVAGKEMFEVICFAVGLAALAAILFEIEQTVLDLLSAKRGVLRVRGTTIAH